MIYYNNNNICICFYFIIYFKLKTEINELPKDKHLTTSNKFNKEVYIKIFHQIKEKEDFLNLKSIICKSK